MKIKVVKRMNTRIAPTGSNEPPSRYFQKGIERVPGEEIEVVKRIKGENVFFNGEGNDQWYFDGINKYYWSGGVSVISSAPAATAIQINHGWSIRHFGIERIWQHYTGKNIRVAILDTGMEDLNNSDFNLIPANCYNVLNNTTNVKDFNGHGTSCASIAGAKGNKGLRGVAPDCELIIIKINPEFANGTGKLNATELNKNLELGIIKADQLNAHIISISTGSGLPDSNVNNVIAACINKGIICIAAAGNDPLQGVEYPANTLNMISVASLQCLNPQTATGSGQYALSKYSAKKVKNTPADNGITISAPGHYVTAYTLDNIIDTNCRGTSFAAPYVAGVAALWLEFMNGKPMSVNNNAHYSFKKEIKDNANNSLTGYDKLTWGAGIINPGKIIHV